MISDGKGGLIGDQLSLVEGQMFFYGLPTKVVTAEAPLQCRFAFTDAAMDEEQWFHFNPPRSPIHGARFASFRRTGQH